MSWISTDFPENKWKTKKKKKNAVYQMLIFKSFNNAANQASLQFFNFSDWPSKNFTHHFYTISMLTINNSIFSTNVARLVGEVGVSADIYCQTKIYHKTNAILSEVRNIFCCLHDFGTKDAQFLKTLPTF